MAEGGKGLIACQLLISILFCGFLIAMIIVGAKNMDECTYNSNIPIWLIVMGSISLFSSILLIILRSFQLQEDYIEENESCYSCFFIFITVQQCLFGLFNLAWMIVGSIWIYSIRYKISNTPGDLSYCNSSLYDFAFGTITFFWVIIGLAIIGGCIVAIQKAKD